MVFLWFTATDEILGNVQLGGFTLGKIYQVSTIVIMAITMSTFLALTLWPTSAVSELRQLMITSTNSFSEMVSLDKLNSEAVS